MTLLQTHVGVSNHSCMHLQAYEHVNTAFYSVSISSDIAWQAASTYISEINVSGRV